MSSDDYRPKRFFTLDEANAALPLVRAITSDLVELARDVVDRRERLATLTSSRPSKGHDVYTEELAQIERDLQGDGRRLQEFVTELQQLGVEPKGAIDGLVDFPAQMNGRIVFLCWKLGEPVVTHWHELDAGFAGRQPLSTIPSQPATSACG